MAAANSLGFGPYSTPNSVGSLIEVLPAAPVLGPQRYESGCTTTSIEVFMPAVVYPDNGGSDIISYSLDWDAGSGASFTTLVGVASLSQDQYFTQTGLTAGSTYRFRYRVENVHGWSSFSPIAAILSAKAPDEPLAPSAAIVGQSVALSWSAPLANGSPVNAYKIEILALDGLSWL